MTLLSAIQKSDVLDALYKALPKLFVCIHSL